MLQDTNLPVLDIDEDFVDTTALVYVEPRADCTLSHWIEQCIASERGLPDESLLQFYVLQLLLAVDVLGRHNVPHRTFCAERVVMKGVGWDACLRVCEFFEGEGEDREWIAECGGPEDNESSGSSPEQGQADVSSVGIVARQMLGMGWTAKPVTTASGLSEGFCSLLNSMVHPEAAKRPQASEAIQRLSAWLFLDSDSDPPSLLQLVDKCLKDIASAKLRPGMRQLYYVEWLQQQM
jgi:hypothetical protein